MSEDEATVLARLAGLAIAPGHMPGVIRNLEILQRQIALLEKAPLDQIVEPAAVFRP